MRYLPSVPTQSRISAPGPQPGTVRLPSGEVLAVPQHWCLLPPGDAALTGRVKKAGPHWVMQEKRGNKMFSRGVWAPTSTVELHKRELLAERASPSYARKLEAGREKRAAEQEAYAQEFHSALVRFLAFAPRHQRLSHELADAVTAQSIAVGSGTVARTERIPIERRAEAAVIAWLRHATTEYDDMKIPRIKGARREMRRMLADRSRLLLERYRKGEATSAENCPLGKALQEQGKKLPF